MRIVVLVTAIGLLAPSLAIGQGKTADGIAAIMSGDNTSAVQILKPLAEETPDPDPLAAFFLATLYHAGKGVGRNEFRACGLYLKSAVPANPFSSQALALARAIHRDHPLGRQECEQANLNRWIEPPVASFSLGSNHWVQIDSNGFVVGYNGQYKPVTTTLGGAGWVFLPTKLSEVDVTRPVAGRRHFIEFLIWMPQHDADNPAWMLLWIPYEIVGIDAFLAIRGGIVVTRADRPSTGESVADAIKVRVNADGEAEWVIGGASSRSGPIPYPQGK